MRNNTTRRNGKPAKAAADTDKLPKNLSLSKGVIDMGEELAKQDRRDLSAEVSWLIDQEFARRRQTV